MQGGGIDASNNSLNFNGNITFRSNSADQNGGGICDNNGTLKIICMMARVQNI